MRYDYDMTGPGKDEDIAKNRIHQASMEAGERWMLNDVAGKPIYAWDSRGFLRRITLRRVAPPDGNVRDGERCRTAGRAHGVWRRPGRGQQPPDARLSGLRRGGVVTSEAYDFKGNLLRGRRELLPELSAGRGLAAKPRSERRHIYQQHDLRRAQPAPLPSPRRTTASIARPTTKPICSTRWM